MPHAAAAGSSRAAQAAIGISRSAYQGYRGPQPTIAAPYKADSPCGACAAMAPELFAMDEATEKPVLLLAEAPVDDVERAMAFCPHDCIEGL